MARYDVAVDLGKYVAGIAVFRDTDLVHGSEVRIRRRAADEPHTTTANRMVRALLARAQFVSPFALGGTWHAEKMVDYAGKHARKADLEHLRVVATKLRQQLAPTRLRLYKAQAWKGNVPKAACKTRIEAVLSEVERGRLLSTEWASKEVVDAIGIGLFGSGRVRRGVVPIPR